MKVKKVLCLSIIFSFIALCFAEDVTITYVMNSGREFKKVVSSDTSSLVLDLPRMHVKEIKGLEQLQYVKNLEIYTQEIDNLDFIPQFTNLETIFISQIKLDSLDYFTNLTNLKEITLDNGVTEDFADKINKREVIDFGKLKDLKKITIKDENIVCVPNIKVCDNKVTLNIANTGIEDLSQSDVDTLKPFYMVILNHSFVREYPKTLQWLRNENISYDAR